MNVCYPAPVIRIALCSIALLACRRAPPDPSQTASTQSASPTTPARSAPTAYHPAQEAVRTRLLAQLAANGGNADASASREIRELRRIDVPGVPAEFDTWAFRDGTDTWRTVVVSEGEIAIDLEGAERIVAARTARNETPTAVELARVIGTLHYYPWRIYDGHDWLGAAGDTPTTQGATPALFTRNNIAGRVLMFSYSIPEGTPGAGIHVANIRITDSGYLIDAAPRPDRR